MRYLNDPEGHRLPVKIDAASNGEFEPIALEAVHHLARRMALDAAGENAKRLGIDRRSFLVSSCGVATTLMGMNAAYASRGARGGFFELPRESALDPYAARSVVDGHEFIFDVQGHFVNPTGAWTKRLPPTARPLQFPKTRTCGPANVPAALHYPQWIGPD